MSLDPAGASSFVELLSWRAEAQPERLAYQFLVDGMADGPRLTYGELDALARSIAAKLGILTEPGDRALMLFPPGLEFVCAFFGCLYARVIGVPAYPPRPHRDMNSLLAVASDCQAKVVLSTNDIASSIESRTRDHSCLENSTWLAVDELLRRPAPRWSGPVVESSDLALLQYTSGSTSSPKGVMVSHQNLISNSDGLQRAFDLTPDSVTVCWLPSFHDMGLIDGVLQPLFTGFPAYLMAPVAFIRQPFRWLQAISRYGADHCGGPNFLFDLCVDKVTDEERALLDLHRWRSAYNGAEPVRARTLERFAESFARSGLRPESLFPCYGLAEATLMVCGSRLDERPATERVNASELANHRFVPACDDRADAITLVSSGRAIADTKLVIVDPQSCELVPPGEIGEIWIAGPGVAQGYWNRTEQTSNTFRARLQPTGEGPFLRSGDLGAALGSELFVTGRIKDLIIIRGRNHYPQDIEATVQAVHPGLRVECGAAFGVDLEGREQLVIVQELDHRWQDLPLRDLTDDIRQAVVEEHDVEVRDIVLVRHASIPKTTSGKIRRHACRIAYHENQLKRLTASQGRKQVCYPELKAPGPGS